MLKYLYERLLGRGKTREVAHILFSEVIKAARQVKFYEDYQVSDSLDGRFDLISLHFILLLDRFDIMASPGPAKQVQRYLQEILFDNLDLSLREMGVGDLSVGKKIKVMAEAFYGRRQAYLEALAKGSEALLEKALLRNLYRAQSLDHDISGLVRYVINQKSHIDGQSDQDILHGRINFLKP